MSNKVKNRKIQDKMYNKSRIHPAMEVMIVENLPMKLQIKKRRMNQIEMMIVIVMKTISDHR
jgi:hypothetical protein